MELDASSVGGKVGDASVIELVVADRAQPFAAETVDVVEACGGGREDLVVAGPADAFAGRAVGGYVDGVAPETPTRYVVEVVEVFVAAGEGTGGAQIGMDHPHGEVRRVQWGGAALQACVAESVDRVAGLEGLASGAGGGDLVVLDEDGDRVAGALDVEVGGGQVAGGRVEVFAVVDHGAGAYRAEVGEREPAGGVLAEVGDPGAALQPGERAAGQVLDVAYGRGRGPVDRGAVTASTRTGSAGPRAARRSVI